jgi:hypothetical protein
MVSTVYQLGTQILQRASRGMQVYAGAHRQSTICMPGLMIFAHFPPSPCISRLDSVFLTAYQPLLLRSEAKNRTQLHDHGDGPYLTSGQHLS